MVSSFKNDFSVTWEDPADGQMSWLFDPMHLPAPMCPLVGDFWGRMFSTYMGARMAYVNGYGYSTVPMPRPPSPESERDHEEETQTGQKHYRYCCCCCCCCCCC